MRGYSRRHWRRLSNGGPDTPERIAARAALNAVFVQVSQERKELFGEVSVDNAAAIVDFQERRVCELRRERGL